MAWHIYEKLLEQVANRSRLFGKFWITFLFVFRLIMIASIGDTVYSDEQSAFKCNTLQPGCENVCFSHFSPISHIRFWAVQILFVGTPSVIYIVYAAHRLSIIAPSPDDKKTKRRSIHKPNEKASSRELLRRPQVADDDYEYEKSTSGGNQHLPRYEEVCFDEKEWSNSKKFNGRRSRINKTSDVSLAELGISSQQCRIKNLNSDADITKTKQTEPLTQRKSSKEHQRSTQKIKRKRIYKHDDIQKTVTTRAIDRAYNLQVLVRTMIEVGFLYLQYRMFKFDVKERYLCKGYPCPLDVECFVSRPMEKTIFLRFTYAMSLLSLLLNLVELGQIGSRWRRKRFRKIRSSPKSDDFFKHSVLSDETLSVREITVSKRSTDWVMGLPVIHSAYPKVGPFPRSHDSSLGDSSDGGTIDSDHLLYVT